MCFGLKRKYPRLVINELFLKYIGLSMLRHFIYFKYPGRLTNRLRTIRKNVKNVESVRSTLLFQKCLDAVDDSYDVGDGDE